jgi:nitrogen fixation protein NifB
MKVYSIISYTSMKSTEEFLVAVASRDGKTINQHFGHAERFLIYKAGREKIDFVEERPVNRYCLGMDTYNHTFEEDRFMRVAEAIKDCRYVLVSRIGGTPETRLKRLGISSVMVYDFIEEGIRRVLDMEMEI